MNDTDPRIRYLVGVTLSQTGTLQEFLQKLGSGLDPQRDCAYRTKRGTVGIPRVLMGDDAPELHAGITAYLNRRGAAPLPQGNPSEWDAQQTHSFLELAVLNFDWRDGRPSGSWWEREEVPWRRITRNFPAIFGQETGDETGDETRQDEHPCSHVRTQLQGDRQPCERSGARLLDQEWFCRQHHRERLNVRRIHQWMAREGIRCPEHGEDRMSVSQDGAQIRCAASAREGTASGSRFRSECGWRPEDPPVGVILE